MMLSKVAERIYWAARYLERVESTARLLSIYDKLLFDLPRQVNLGWYNLIVINSLEQDFNERYSVRDERNVVKFLLGDESNYSSVISSLQAVRENIRTTRDVIPPETWEMVNELTLYVQENLTQGINRSNRHDFLDNIIKACQQVVGLWYVNMPRDEAWDMVQLGQNIERADMTTRNLDAGVAAILQVEDDDFAVNSRQIIWGNVLRSLNADQPFRRTTRSSVKGDLVVRYLLADEDFPRSLFYCITQMADVASGLPKSKAVVTFLRQLQDEIPACAEPEELGDAFRDMLNTLQLTLAEVHTLIGKTWFLSDR
ncbi:MAG: alpha-E domain-containing protein [Saccharospirillaceae bacterium]|nr:alpha-E domain-containing protein [Saccharospirillaceae bacterium]MCD8530132.1 alpha-E domain-containing protein [Saccharospirillaceae bacterium]